MRAAQRAGMQVLLIVLVLVGVGLVMVYSSSSVLANARFADSSFFLERQLARAGLGLVIMFALARVPLFWWARLSRLFLLLALLLLALVLVYGRGPVNRWLPVPALLFNLSFQPAEFAKLALVLYLADVMARKEEVMGDFKKGLVPRLLVVGLVLVLIALQPNLGMAIAMGLIALAQLWVGGARPLHLLGLCLGALAAIALSVLSTPYQMQRLVNFIWPSQAPDGNYQVAQSLVGLGSGGWWGVGLGNSMQKQQYLPEPHTDFVFAFVGEELGLAGTLGVLGLFVAFAVQGLRLARCAPSYYGFLVGVGITVMISTYAAINIGVVTGVLPTTGLPLPFISYGGSSLVWNLGGVGILLGLARAQSRTAWISVPQQRARILVRPRR
jgi:cell division protein FtsW